MGCPLIFLQWQKIATSNLVHSLDLSRPVIKSHPKEKWGWPWVGKLTEILGSTITFLQRLKLVTSNSALSWGLLRTNKNHTQKKKGRGPGLRDLPQFGGSPSIFTQWLKIVTSNLVQLGFAKAYHKISSAQRDRAKLDTFSVNIQRYSLNHAQN